MSGSGGFYKYRCKYFYTHNCTNWVYVNNAPCANCLAEGRDSPDRPVQNQPAWNASPRDIYVPFFRDGVLQYSLMEIIATDQSGMYWQLRQKLNHPQFHTVPTTSDQPRAVFVTASVLPQQTQA